MTYDSTDIGLAFAGSPVNDFELDFVKLVIFKVRILKLLRLDLALFHSTALKSTRPHSKL
jgi:hypothetical protein